MPLLSVEIACKRKRSDRSFEALGTFRDCYACFRRRATPNTPRRPLATSASEAGSGVVVVHCVPVTSKMKPSVMPLPVVLNVSVLRPALKPVSRRVVLTV